MPKENLPVVTIYTDGACEPNPGPGGWAFLLTFENGQEVELTGSNPETTNNRMELTAIIEALKALDDCHVIELFSDSQYCQKIVTDYYNHLTTNFDLVDELVELKHKHKIHFHWVRGGSDPMNIMVDRMSRMAINNPVY